MSARKFGLPLPVAIGKSQIEASTVEMKVAINLPQLAVLDQVPIASLRAVEIAKTKTDPLRRKSPLLRRRLQSRRVTGAMEVVMKRVHQLNLKT